MVTNSRKMFPLPMTRRVRSPRYLRSCGASPIDAIGKICVLVADLGPALDDDRRPDAAVGADRGRPGRSRRCGPIDVPAPMRRRRMHVRRRVDVRRAGLDRQQQLGLGDDLVLDIRGRVNLRQPSSGPAQASLPAGAGRLAPPGGGIWRC